jgi:metallo-beta-lactamase family protein
MVCDTFAARLQREFGYDATAPYTGESYDLASMHLLTEGNREHKKNKPKASRANDVFQRLLDAGMRLMSVIRKNEGCANKDLAKFTSQIQALCDKWDR